MKYLVQRLVHGLVSLLLLFTLTFVLLRTVPGDPAQLLAGPSATAEDVARLRVQLGLHQPTPIQYMHYMSGIARGDLGRSTRTDRPVLSEIVGRVPASALLGGLGMVIAIALGLVAGMLAATRRNGAVDLLVTSLAIAANSVPAFWLALLLIDTLAIRGAVLPSSGYGTWQHLVMPALVIAATQVGMIARLTRNTVLETLHADYVRTARAKGLPGRYIFWIHALRNALAPIITIIGLQFGLVLGGAVITETIFRWPGVGRLLIDSVLNRDYPTIEGLVLFFGVVFIAANLIVDVLNHVIDPRLRL